MEQLRNALAASPALPMTIRKHDDAVPGTWNFRDVGGVPTAGGVIRSGVLYRSAALAQLDTAGLLALESLGVREVFDLRGHREIAREGVDRVPAGVRVTVAPFHPEDNETPAHEVQQDEVQQDEVQQDGAQRDGAKRDAGQQVAGQQDAGQPWTGAARLRAYYAAIPTLAPAQQSVATLLRTLATGSASVLVHCAAGKDRTGWAVSTVLRAVGVDQDAVLADYLLSNTAVESLRTWMIAQYGDGALRADNDILGVDESYLRAGWDAADAAFGSFDGYLEAIGVEHALLGQLRARLVG